MGTTQLVTLKAKPRKVRDDNKGNTLFQTRTDNTGRAELRNFAVRSLSK